MLSQTGKHMEAYTLFLNLEKLFSTSTAFLLTKAIFIQLPFLKMESSGNVKQSWIC